MPRFTWTSLATVAVAALLVTTGPARSADEGTKSNQSGAPAQANNQNKDGKPIRALLVLGGCCHDYEHQKEIISKGISERANVEWVIAHDPSTKSEHLNPIYENPDWYKGFDVIVHDECSATVADPAVIERILKPHKEGLPGVVLHCAMHSYRTAGWDKAPAVTPWFEFTGLPSIGHGPQLPISISFVDKENPITKGMEDWTTIPEEHYNNRGGDPLPTAHAIARGKQTIKDRRSGKETTNDFVVAWTNTYNGKTKVFGTTIGHNNQTVSDPRYLDLLTRGLLWSVGKLDEQHLKDPKAAKAEK